MKKIITEYLKPFYGRMAIGVFFKFTGSIMDLIIPSILALIIDQVIPLNQKAPIFYWGGVMVICAIVGMVFNIIANRMAARVASDATEIIRHDLFARVIYFSNHQMDTLTKPSVISRLTADTYIIHQMIIRIQRLGVRAPIMLVGGIIITMTLDPGLAMVLIGIMPVMMLIIILVSRKSMPLFAGLQQALDGFVRVVREDINGIRVIKALSKTDYEKNRFDTINTDVVNREKKARMTVAVISPAMNICLNLGLVSVVVVGAYGVNNGTSEVGIILAFMTYFTIILHAVLALSKLFEMWPKATASADRITQALDSVDALAVLEWPEDPEADAANLVKFDNVTFSYNKEEPNLTNISFTLKKGETLGIIGETGAGKTTLLNLLMRLYDVDEGKISIAGRDIRSMDPRELHQKFGVVFQNDMIFEATIEENIDLGRNLSKEAIKKAIVCAGAKAFVDEKADKSGEQLTIKGANLSGGQKQRILIARALAASPEILVLDDASSALDYQTDAVFRKAIKENFGDTTIIIVAQRISSIRHADHILVLEDGVAIGYGKHKHLMKSCEIYREISHSQMGVSSDATITEI
ncbi:ABC transporter ATP-binding protein/permease [Acetobacterium wieringae]|uniref:ABC transporter ATP-binding protein/permease n=1 Tax=Acetobacterium wieringae TaxID=52694 RepID=A0ABY6HDE9_9FIRM|nr:ABC transporter ATP-binding protein [Acetobacterium wieringae]UYO62519.1 ABC transporter ATP-binding protein/permease [Acetobacterium wieringae]VUZ23225.1 putative ABC transporter ATP-binding protein [Acetobacterium wieringae]